MAAIKIYLSSLLVVIAINIQAGDYLPYSNAAPYGIMELPVRTDTSSQNILRGATFHYSEINEEIKALMEKYELPGVTVAIVRNEKLIYINCYGVQDPETRAPVQNNNLFRIASISKPITVVAILRLIQEGKLSMNSEVFGAEGILGEDFGKLPENSGWYKITIRHLIEHKSGIHNIPNDPMFSYTGFTNKEIISTIIKERTLTSEPGNEYHYSNVGYNILGRVIEKITGIPYEEYVKTYILAPCGIKRMQIACNTKEERISDEVVYSQPDEPGWVYGMDVRRMDSHGGWLASATDLARFIVHIDRNCVVQDIIQPQWLGKTYMGFTQWAITGSLPGTATMLCRMNDEFSFVILANRRSHEKDFWTDISSAMQKAISVRKDWPDIDLFDKIEW